MRSAIIFTSLCITADYTDRVVCVWVCYVCGFGLFLTTGFLPANRPAIHCTCVYLWRKCELCQPHRSTLRRPFNGHGNSFFFFSSCDGNFDWVSKFRIYRWIYTRLNKNSGVKLCDEATTRGYKSVYICRTF